VALASTFNHPKQANGAHSGHAVRQTRRSGSTRTRQVSKCSGSMGHCRWAAPTWQHYRSHGEETASPVNELVAYRAHGQCALMMLPSCSKMPTVCIIASWVHFRKYTCNSTANLPKKLDIRKLKIIAEFTRHQNKRA